MTKHPRTADLKSFRLSYESILEDLADLRDDIDDLGTLGDRIAGTIDADQLACYAANTLEGCKSLLREMHQAVTTAPPLRVRRRMKR